MASSHQQAYQILSQYTHRHPLDGDQIRALCSALTSLNRYLGDENAVKKSVYCAILRLLKAHVTPFPLNAPVTFSQVQAARLQLLAEKLVSEHKSFPPQLLAAIHEGLVSGFDQRTGEKIPIEQQKHQLAQQQLFDRHQIVDERKRLQERQADFSHARHACLNAMRVRERQQAGPDPDLFIPWEQRTFKVNPQVAPANSVTPIGMVPGSSAMSAGTNFPNNYNHMHAGMSDYSATMAYPSVHGTASDLRPPNNDRPETAVHAPLDVGTLMTERDRIISSHTGAVVKDISRMFQNHKDGSDVLSPRYAALLETRVRHVNLLALQARMRRTVWEEHLSTERDGKRGNRGRARTLKQLQREFEKVERARTRQIEAEERDARRKRQAWMNAMVEHLNKFRGYHRDVVRRGMRAVTKAVLKHHEEVAKNTSRAEREAERARIQKLKEDDEEGYLELVRQTKNTRLLELLDQTDKYLKELGAVVKEERAKSGVVEYENGREKQGSRVNYYEIAHAIKEDVRQQSSLLVGGKLKEYQLQGIQWMVSLYNNRLNGILADEMGLGKTIQTLGLIAHLMETKDNPGPYLIIVPLSTISNWEAEFARWSPVIRVIVFKGDAKTRRKLYEEVIEKKSFNVCLVTYEYVVRGKNLLKRVEWQHLIIDEGHRIKNHESRLSAVLHAHYRSRNRLLLTGTPLQNSLTELWALLNFLLPNVFKSAESFESWFAAPFAQMGVGNVANNDEQAQLTEEESLLIIRRLHQVLRPFLLRRLKSDVLRMGEQLPEKQEHNLMCEMSAWQKHMYVKILKSERVLFTDKHGRQRYDKLSNPAIQLRKCVNHPYLFFADHASKLVDSPQLWRASGKFDMLDAIITKQLQTGHRILIFNQMTKVVDLQERLLKYRNIPFYRLDGTTSTDERKQMVNDFNDESTDVHVFLLTTRAGGLGVNLQTADTVIIFDSDWNPQMDQQAQDRAHRIGQRREVLVVRLLTAKSIEENVLERASFKRGLEKKIIRAGMFDEQSKDSERQAMLRELLRVEGGSDDDHPEDGVQTDEEINRLLARNEEEFEKFTKIDEERSKEIGSRPRLVSDKEIPEWAIKVPKALVQKAKIASASTWTRDIDGVDLEILNEPKKRRAATTNVSYGVDQLSERQYIKLMERSEAGEELSYDTLRAATQRKRRKKKDKDETDREDDDEEDDDNDDSSVQASDKVSRDGGKDSKVSGIGSKSLSMDMKEMENDENSGDEDSDEQSGDDLIIADDDDDDDDQDHVVDDDDDDDDDDALVTPTKENGVESDKDDAKSVQSDEDIGTDSSRELASHSVSPAMKSVRGRKRRPELSTSSKKVRKRMRHDPSINTSPSSQPANSISNASAAKKLVGSASARPGSDSDDSDDSATPIRRPLSRKRPKRSSRTIDTDTAEDSNSSGDEHSSKRPTKKPKGSPESRGGRIQRLDRTLSPQKNLQSGHNDNPSSMRSQLDGQAPQTNSNPPVPHKDDGLQSPKSPSKEPAVKMEFSPSKGAPRKAVSDSKHPSASSRTDTMPTESEKRSSSTVLDTSASRTVSSPFSVRKAGLASSPPDKTSLTVVTRKGSVPSLNLTSSTTALPKLSSVPVGLPKLSSAPLVKKSASLSSDSLKAQQKPTDSLSDLPTPRKVPGPPSTIDEASLPVLRKIPLSSPKKGASSPNANMSHPVTSPTPKSNTTTTTLPVLSSKPIPPAKSVAKGPLLSKPLLSSKTSIPPTKSILTQKQSPSKSTSPKPPHPLSKSTPVSGSTAASSSALNSASLPSAFGPKSLIQKSNDAPRPILSSIALISSKPAISSRLLSGTAPQNSSTATKSLSGKVGVSIPRPATGTQRGRVSDKSAIRNSDERQYPKSVIRADSTLESNGKVPGSSMQSTSSDLHKRPTDNKRPTNDLNRQSSDAKRPPDSKRLSSETPEKPRSADTRRKSIEPPNQRRPSSDPKRQNPLPTRSSSRTARKSGKPDTEDGEIREEGELSEGSQAVKPNGSVRKQGTSTSPARPQSTQPSRPPSTRSQVANQNRPHPPHSRGQPGAAATRSQSSAHPRSSSTPPARSHPTPQTRSHSIPPFRSHSTPSSRTQPPPPPSRSQATPPSRAQPTALSRASPQSSRTQPTSSSRAQSTPSTRTQSVVTSRPQMSPSTRPQPSPSTRAQSTPSTRAQSTPSTRTQSTPSGRAQSSSSTRTQSTPSSRTQPTTPSRTQPTTPSRIHSTPPSRSQATPPSRSPSTPSSSSRTQPPRNRNAPPPPARSASTRPSLPGSSSKSSPHLKTSSGNSGSGAGSSSGSTSAPPGRQGGGPSSTRSSSTSVSRPMPPPMASSRPMPGPMTRPGSGMRSPIRPPSGRPGPPVGAPMIGMPHLPPPAGMPPPMAIGRGMMDRMGPPPMAPVDHGQYGGPAYPMRNSGMYAAPHPHGPPPHPSHLPPGMYGPPPPPPPSHMGSNMRHGSSMAPSYRNSYSSPRPSGPPHPPPPPMPSSSPTKASSGAPPPSRNVRQQSSAMSSGSGPGGNSGKKASSSSVAHKSGSSNPGPNASRKTYPSSTSGHQSQGAGSGGGSGVTKKSGEFPPSNVRNSNATPPSSGQKHKKADDGHNKPKAIVSAGAGMSKGGGAGSAGRDGAKDSKKERKIPPRKAAPGGSTDDREEGEIDEEGEIKEGK